MSAYVDCELTGTDMLAIRRHLSECADCADEYESIRLVKQAVSRLRTVAPRKDLVAAIAGRLDEAQVTSYQRFATWATRFAHGKLSPVAAALAASGVALVLMTAGGIDGFTPGDEQSAAAALGSRTHEVAFLREVSRSPIDFGIPGPPAVPSERLETGNGVHLAILNK